MEKEHTLSKTEMCLKGNGLIMILMVKEFLLFLMEMFITVISNQVNSTDSEDMYTKTTMFMKDIGLKINGMEKDNM